MKIPEGWEIIILKRRRVEKEGLPPLSWFLGLFLWSSLVVGGLAWLLHFGGLTDEQWHALFWLRWIPTGIIGTFAGVILTPKALRLVKKLREYTEIKQ